MLCNTCVWTFESKCAMAFTKPKRIKPRPQEGVTGTCENCRVELDAILAEQRRQREMYDE